MQAKLVCNRGMVLPATWTKYCSMSIGSLIETADSVVGSAAKWTGLDHLLNSHLAATSNLFVILSGFKSCL